MALKRLTTVEMIQLSAPLVATESPPRAAIEKAPPLAALFPQLVTAHTGLLVLQVRPEDPRLAELSNREAEVDADHDDRVRCLYGALTALSLLPGHATELTRLCQMLFPEGLAHTQKTYRGEAGHAAMVAAHLDADTRARLKAVLLYDTNALALTDDWLKVAAQLGAMEDERARLSPTPSTSADINEARLAWVRIMNAMVANAELANLDADTDRLLFGPLRAAEQTADKRRGKAASARPPVPEPEKK